MTLTGKRLGVLVLAVGLLELTCRMGWVSRITIVAPSEMATQLWRLPSRGDTDDILYTLKNIVAAIGASVVLGFIAGAVIHALPRLRSILDPLLASYYAVPIFVFYPLLIVIFGVNAIPLIIIGAMFGIVAMIMNTLIGLDRVPRALAKSARLFRLGPLQELYLISLPAAAPHFITGIKFAVIYSAIAVIAGEFILSSRGMGHRISYAYNNFEGGVMYAFLLLLLTTVTIVTLTLHTLEKRVHQRWGRE